MNTSQFSQSLEQYKQAILDQAEAQIDLAQDVENQFRDYSENIDKSLQKIIDSLNPEKIETLLNEKFEIIKRILQEKSTKLDNSIVSKRGIDYTRLKNYLVMGDWEKAKQESLSIIRSMVVENTENLIKGLQQQTSSTVIFNEIEYDENEEEKNIIQKEYSFEEYFYGQNSDDRNSFFIGHEELFESWVESWVEQTSWPDDAFLGKRKSLLRDFFNWYNFYGSFYDFYLHQLYFYLGEKLKHKQDDLLSEEKLGQIGLLRFFYYQYWTTNIRFSELESLFENLKSSFRDYVLQVVDYQFIQEIIIITKLWETLSHRTLGLSHERKQLTMLELIQNCVSKKSVPVSNITDLSNFKNDIFLNLFPNFSKDYVYKITKDSYYGEKNLLQARNRIKEKYDQKSSCTFSCLDILEALKYDQFFTVIGAKSSYEIRFSGRNESSDTDKQMEKDYRHNFESLTMNFQWELFNTLHSLIEEVESAGNSNTDRSSS